MNVSQIFRVGNVDGDVGVEVEVIGRDLPCDLEYWRREHDGSLNEDGVEYVLRTPIAIGDVDKPLDELAAGLKDSKLVNSVMPGVHVHVNVQHMNVVQLFTFIAAYLCFENVLVKFCGDSREGNLFCLRSSDAHCLTDLIVKAIETRKLRPHFATDDIRYASINLKALTNYGSVEFRAMRSDGDMEAIKNWCQILVKLRDNSMNFKDPKDLISGISMMGVEDLTDRLFGEYSHHIKDIPDYQEVVRECVRDTAQDIAYCINWDTHFAKKVNSNPFAAALGGEDNEEVYL